MNMKTPLKVKFGLCKRRLDVLRAKPPLYAAL
jgi:hypothetical protein